MAEHLLSAWRHEAHPYFGLLVLMSPTADAAEVLPKAMWGLWAYSPPIVPIPIAMGT